jgi:hypothetical protein
VEGEGAGEEAWQREREGTPTEGERAREGAAAPWLEVREVPAASG